MADCDKRDTNYTNCKPRAGFTMNGTQQVYFADHVEKNSRPPHHTLWFCLVSAILICGISVGECFQRW